MITANVPSIALDRNELDDFLQPYGLKSVHLDLAAEALMEAVRREDAKHDVADLVMGVRNNAAFKALASASQSSGIMKRRSPGGKEYLGNADGEIKILVHNTDSATALGAHMPGFASQRARRATSYIHDEAQGELELPEDVIEFSNDKSSSPQTTIDLCIFAEKADGQVTCRYEVLVDAKLNKNKRAFSECSKRFGVKVTESSLVYSSPRDNSQDTEDFSGLVTPKKRNEN